MGGPGVQEDRCQTLRHLRDRRSNPTGVTDWLFRRYVNAVFSIIFPAGIGTAANWCFVDLYTNSDLESLNSAWFADTMKWITGFSGWTHSIDTPGVANSGSNQTILSREWMEKGNIEKNALEWYKPQNTLGDSFVAWIPDNATQMLDPELLDIYAVR